QQVFVKNAARLIEIAQATGSDELTENFRRFFYEMLVGQGTAGPEERVRRQSNGSIDFSRDRGSIKSIVLIKEVQVYRVCETSSFRTEASARPSCTCFSAHDATPAMFVSGTEMNSARSFIRMVASAICARRRRSTACRHSSSAT